MEAGDSTDIRPGLRERKKQKTRETIIKVALELFAERGYERTTVAEIADAAEVSPRTIFTYFPSKEDILFSDLPELQARLEHALRDRPEGATTLDALREFILESLNPGRNRRLRKLIVGHDETLRRSERARFAPLEQLVIEAIADDLHTDADDIRPQIVAASLIAAFKAVYDPAAAPESFSPQHATTVIADVMEFLHGGLYALRHANASRQPVDATG